MCSPLEYRLSAALPRHLFTTWLLACMLVSVGCRASRVARDIPFEKKPSLLSAQAGQNSAEGTAALNDDGQEMEKFEPPVYAAEARGQSESQLARPQSTPDRSQAPFAVAPELASYQLENSSDQPQEAARAVPPTAEVRLIVNGVRTGRGAVKIAIFTDAAAFPDAEHATQTISLDSSHATLLASLPIDSPFAAAVYQDINSDGTLNRNRLGIPTEPFAFSNDARGLRGPPTFAQALVSRPAEIDAPFSVPLNLP